MISKIYTISLLGIEGFLVEVEVDIQSGLPSFNMVGLPDTVVKESKERVKSAIKNSGYELEPCKIIVNFAPADLKKEGPHLDLAVAVGILSCLKIIEYHKTIDTVFIGELSLNGEIRGVRGVLPMVLEARKKFKKIFIPFENWEEVSFIDDVYIYPVNNLNEVVDLINTNSDPEFLVKQSRKEEDNVYEFDFSEVKGQKFVKRAIEVAVSGGHNVLMIGPPGSGKSMIAQRVPTILPKLSIDEAIEVTKIYSVAGLLKEKGKLITIPPFRSPHHTVSYASFIGGGSNPLPGEVSLAHNGVLFMDELPEFRRDVLESLRQPLEDGQVLISRVKGKVSYPARFMLIASMNPCPCGYYGYPYKQCHCSENQIRNYLNRISGPLLDRLDIHISVEPVGYEELRNNLDEESSSDIRNRVCKARQIQRERFKEDGIFTNSQMKSKHIKKYCKLSKDADRLLESAFKNLNLSSRGYVKIIKVARTIADIEDSDIINEKHIAEAIQYRMLDRKLCR
ncbi:magnesium chelatase family protein [Caloramator fervidus]|uniref:Magnesium chelatase family protein n=1 Tax=Caloramator fervidus TaxID=29344 RepID=A0A1H5XBK3_9CLOT|nr:YifB family Mg chelatase-like AAA ATPase [Caloramator fervidus]SEG09141.1 magnesium chelatase family protein [Caloramator fervidus]